MKIEYLEQGPLLTSYKFKVLLPNGEKKVFESKPVILGDFKTAKLDIEQQAAFYYGQMQDQKNLR